MNLTKEKDDGLFKKILTSTAFTCLFWFSNLTSTAGEGIQDNKYIESVLTYLKTQGKHTALYFLSASPPRREL